MHELSIAQNIIEIIRQNVPEKELGRVRTVSMIIGEQSGILPDSLKFSYHAVTASTELERSLLSIALLPFTIRCKRCGTETRNETGSRQCPRCRSLETTVIAGTEMRMKEIELSDGPPEGQ